MKALILICAVCNGHIGCPVCTPNPHMRECPECEGHGGFFYDDMGNEVTEDVYKSLIPRHHGDLIVCDLCEGTSEIVDDREPDYDNYND